MYSKLKTVVCDANKELHAHGLAPFTWGNVSEVDRAAGVFAIKPSGVPYSELTPEKIVVVSLADGSVVEGDYNPSSDTPTHYVLYKEFSNLNAIVHTHSVNASAFAQAGCSIPAYGTTHADFSYTAVPCTRALTDAEVNGEYEYNTGIVIAEHFKENILDVNSTPAVLVRSHAPFAFGKNASDAVHNAAVLEIVAEMAMKTELIGKDVPEIDDFLSDKHYFRKHGANAYYGQK
ncbi:MAG: L-ribulose-5-phosphate 4-epimerase AraD [Clostridia bacterium]|nr:L-ribulose-5-phosphate 4-epimerase AraD [Clostridia bacterium]